MADKKITELEPASSISALATLYMVQDGLDLRTSLGVLSANLPNSINLGATGFGVSSDIEEISTIPQSKTVIPLALGTSTPITLPNEERQGIVKIFVNKSATPAVVNLNGSGFGTLTLNSLGSSVTLMFIGTNWVIISAYNTSVS